MLADLKVLQRDATRRRSGTDRRVESGRVAARRTQSKDSGLKDSGERPAAPACLFRLAARAARQFGRAAFLHDERRPERRLPGRRHTESLIINLSRLSELRVMAWSTVARFRGREVDALEIGRDLGVRAIFAGRMYQFGEDLVIKTELVDVNDGSQLWGAQYRRKLDDLGAIEQELSIEICERLRIRLNEEERRRLAKRYTENAAAYQAYLKGRYYWNQRTARALRKAVESFEEAIKLDDGYALAYAGLADCYCLVSIYGAAPQSRDAAREGRRHEGPRTRRRAGRSAHVSGRRAGLVRLELGGERA